MAQVVVKLSLDEMVDLVKEDYRVGTLVNSTFNIFNNGEKVFDENTKPDGLVFQFELVEYE